MFSFFCFITGGELLKSDESRLNYGVNGTALVLVDDTSKEEQLARHNKIVANEKAEKSQQWFK